MEMHQTLGLKLKFIPDTAGTTTLWFTSQMNLHPESEDGWRRLPEGHVGLEQPSGYHVHILHNPGNRLYKICIFAPGEDVGTSAPETLDFTAPRGREVILEL